MDRQTKAISDCTIAYHQISQKLVKKLQKHTVAIWITCVSSDTIATGQQDHVDSPTNLFLLQLKGV